MALSDNAQRINCFLTRLNMIQIIHCKMMFITKKSEWKKLIRSIKWAYNAF